jgi:hypothetical protein
MVKEEVHIDARVHSRLIGARGRNIRRIMEQYSVDIKFPRNTDTDPNTVTVIGAEENVLDAKEHLLNLEEEYVSYFTAVLLSLDLSGISKRYLKLVGLCSSFLDKIIWISDQNLSSPS